MNKINTVLADDHAIVLEGIKAVLRDYEEIVIVGEASNGQEVLDFAKKQTVHLAILDINMPVLDGLTCARRLKTAHPHIKIIVLTMYAQKSFMEEIIRIGVDGCLLKSNTGKDLGPAIKRVMEGKSFYDHIQSFTSENEKKETVKLSKRETEIIRFLAEGLTSLQIAEKLFIAEHTIKTHRKNILRKTGTHNTSELVQFALNNKLM
ncbi:MAG TPA: response regulator transcription factor [Ohtaekwangia sp.]